MEYESFHPGHVSTKQSITWTNRAQPIRNIGEVSSDSPCNPPAHRLWQAKSGHGSMHYVRDPKSGKSMRVLAGARYAVLNMRSVHSMQCLICEVSLLCSAYYAKCPY